MILIYELNLLSPDTILMTGKLTEVSKRLSFRFFLIITACLLSSVNNLSSQSVGDYKSVANGVWTDLSIWERFNGSDWDPPTLGEGYPAQYTSPSRIDIDTDVTLNTNLTRTSNPRINDLRINTSGVLELSSFQFTVNGKTDIYGTLSDQNGSGRVIFYHDIYIDATGKWNAQPNTSDNLRVFGDISSNSNEVILKNIRVYSDVILSGSGSIRVTNFFNYEQAYTVTNESNVFIDFALNSNNKNGVSWINKGTLTYSGSYLLLGSGGIFDASAEGNTVNYSVSVNQNIRNTIYYNLITSGGGTKSLIGDTRVDGSLTMTAGDILTGSNILTLNNPSPAALNHTSGIIIGNFERFINQTGTYYNFPVGVSGQLHSFDISFQDLTSGSLLVKYIEGDPGRNGLPLIDSDGTGIIDQYTTGYWTARARNSLATADYMLNLDASGFGPYPLFRRPGSLKGQLQETGFLPVIMLLHQDQCFAATA